MDAEDFMNVLSEMARLSEENHVLRHDVKRERVRAESLEKDFNDLCKEHGVNVYRWRLGRSKSLKSWDWAEIVSNSTGGDNAKEEA